MRRNRASAITTCLLLSGEAHLERKDACYLGDINVVGVMLGRRDHQCDAFVQLDAGQRSDPHVEEYAKKHSQRDETEHLGHHYGHT